MDLFDKISKKTNEAYQSAKEKTVKISGELKLKNKISDLKYQIEVEYQEIGKLVYEKMKNGEDALKEEITPKCDEVNRLNEEIEKAEAEILALKNIKKCINCGAELKLEAEFCSKCGKEQPKIEIPEVEVSDEDVIIADSAEQVEVTEVKTVENNEESSDTLNTTDNSDTKTSDNNSSEV